MRRAGAALGWAVLVAAAGATLLVAGARAFFVGEILANVRLLVGLASAAAALALLVGRRWEALALAVLLAGVHLAPTARLVLAAPLPAPEGGRELRVLSVNLLYGTADPRRLEELFAELRPDVVGLQEVLLENERGTDWLALFDAWRDRWPHQAVLPHGLSFGLALLSSHPLEDVRWADPEGGVNPYAGRPCLLEATAVVDGRRVEVLVTHPERPGRPWRNRARATVFDAIARNPWSGPMVVMGDLNCTEGSPLFADLLARGGLADTRLGFGPCLSWERPPMPGRWVCLDHVLVRGGIGVRERGTGPDVGSDHLPATAVLVIPPAE